MKTLIDESKKQYKYNCDRCGKEISFENGTLHKIIDIYGIRKSKKACDLCDKCDMAFHRGAFKKKEKNK